MTSQQNQPKKYFVRPSTDADLQNLLKFYASFPHQHVLSRRADVIEGVCKKGEIYLIEDTQGNIVGASTSYRLGESADGLTYKWMEIGTTRLALNGFSGVFDALIGLQILRTCLIEPPCDRVVCQVEAPPVQKIVQTFGFRPYKVSQEALDSRAALLGRPSYTENWFSLGVESMPISARNVIRAATAPFTNAKTGEQIQLDFSRCKFFNYFNAEIAMLAKENYGNPDTPDMNASVARASRAWTRRHF